MGEYTPTTDEVRRAYGDARCVNPYEDHDSGCPEEREFDRWLAAHDAEVRADAIAEVAEKLPTLMGWHAAEMETILHAQKRIRALGGGSR